MRKLEGIIPIDKTLIEPASVTCASAFMDDPLTRYVIPDVRKRPNLRYGFEYYIRMSVLGKAMPFTTSPACEGVTIWHDSREKDPFGLEFRVNPLLLLCCGWLYIIREARADWVAEGIKKKYAPRPHMYLALLAVHPDHQGKGFASRLLRPVLSRLDSDRLPCYLETQNLKNVSMYMHFGFKLIHETVLPGTELPFYIMLRQ